MPPAQINVWFIEIKKYLPEREIYLRQMSEEEQGRASALKVEEKRSQYIITHYWLRRILAELINKPSEQIKIEISPRGKPQLAPQSGDAISFNMSHSGEYAVIATAPRVLSVGVDIEKIDMHKTLSEKLLAKIMSPQERAELARQTKSGAKATFFYHKWTAKEAWVKAHGQGLANMQLSQVEVCARKTHYKIVSLDPKVLLPSWLVVELAAPSGYLGAVSFLSEDLVTLNYRSVDDRHFVTHSESAKQNG